jgi:chemotaxis protein MotB
LSEQYGLQSDHLTAVGHADSRSITDNLTPENRAKNRRVEIVVQERKSIPEPIERAEPRTALEMFGAPQEGVKREASPLSEPVTRQ